MRQVVLLCDLGDIVKDDRVGFLTSFDELGRLLRGGRVKKRPVKTFKVVLAHSCSGRKVDNEEY